MASGADSTVRRVSVEEVEPRPRPRPSLVHPNLNPPPTPEPLPTSPPPEPTSSALEVAVAAFTGLGYALSVRALLLMALVGAFVIGFKAMEAQTPIAMIGLSIYALFTVVPIAYLEIARRS